MNPPGANSFAPIPFLIQYLSRHAVERRHPVNNCFDWILDSGLRRNDELKCLYRHAGEAVPCSDTWTASRNGLFKQHSVIAVNG